MSTYSLCTACENTISNSAPSSSICLSCENMKLKNEVQKLKQIIDQKDREMEEIINLYVRRK